MNMLRHPRLVPVYEAHHEKRFGKPNQITFTMPYYPNGSVQHALLTGRRFSVREAIRLTADVLEGTAYLHDRGFIHRDIKAANALISDSGSRVVLSDFGAAARMDGHGRVAAIVGTLWYMAPEFYTRGYLEPSADLYAAGLVLRELLGGAFPYGSLDRAAADARLRAGTHALPSRVRRPPSYTPRGLRRIVARATHIDPSHRYSTATDFIAALMRANFIDWRPGDGIFEGEARGRSYRVTVTDQPGGFVLLRADVLARPGRGWRRVSGVPPTRIRRNDLPAYWRFFDVVEVQALQLRATR
jgi:serine/threonine-protein kinase